MTENGVLAIEASQVKGYVSSFALAIGAQLVVDGKLQLAAI
jgi:hypothetical protein